MFASSNRRFGASFAGIVLAALLFAGCTGQSTPDGYNDSVRENFVRGCVDTSKEDGSTWSTDECECAYEAIEEDVEWDEFKRITDDQTEEPSPLPESFTEVFADCGQPG